MKKNLVILYKTILTLQLYTWFSFEVTTNVMHELLTTLTCIGLFGKVKVSCFYFASGCKIILKESKHCQSFCSKHALWSAAAWKTIKCYWSLYILLTLHNSIVRENCSLFSCHLHEVGVTTTEKLLTIAKIMPSKTLHFLLIFTYDVGKNDFYSQ